jgi:hypothetical protein
VGIPNSYPRLWLHGLTPQHIISIIPVGDNKTEVFMRESMRRGIKKYHKTLKGRLALHKAKTKYRLKHRLCAPEQPITIKQYRNLEREQGRKCAICETPFSSSPSIDHSHKTGKVRGLLCHKCNLGLGNFGDSVVRLLGAAKYLLDKDY